MALAPAPPQLDLATLDRVQQRVLWLATAIVHHANRVRPNASGVKVGGHQASSASMVSMMTALWFAVLEAPDRVSVKPHASPVLHAINYLLGRLDREYLTTLRQFGGLQSYPSRTKDPDPVDYSTGSVGIGATAPVWGALAHRYVAGHFDVPVGGRQIALIGDAELDEGAIWEAIADPMVAKLGEVMWVVDLNRQSLDRVVPDIAAGRLARDVRGGRLARRDGQVRAAAAAPARRLRARIDAMPNEEYQRLLRADAGELRERLEVGVLPGGRRRAAGRVPRPRRPRPGGADRRLPRGRRRARPPDASCSPTRSRAGGCRPRAIPRTTRRCVSDEQFADLAAALGHRSRRPMGGVRRRARPRPSCARPPRRGCTASRSQPTEPPAVPATLGREHRGRASTQQAFGRFWVDLEREAPAVAAARGHRLAGRRHVHEPRRLDQQGRHLVDRRPDRLVRRRHRHARALARERPRPARRAGDRRGQPRRPARRAGRDVVARRAAPAAGGHDLRPVRGTRAGAVVVRDLRRRAVDPRRHAERRHARPGGRRAPVRDHAVDRDRAARLRRLGAGVRARLRMDVPARAVAARAAQTAAPPTSGCPRGRSTRTLAAGADPESRARARRRLPAARGLGRGDRGDGRARAGGAGGGRGARRVASSASPAPTCCSAPSRRAPASARAIRRSSKSCSRTRSRSSPCSTATRTR